MARISVTDPDKAVEGMVSGYLEGQGHEVYTHADLQAMQHTMDLGLDPQIVVLGNMFGHSPTDNESGFRYVMSELHFKKADERPEYILMSGNLHVESPESVEELLSKGGHYVEKPIKLEDFRLLIEKLAEETIGP